MIDAASSHEIRQAQLRVARCMLSRILVIGGDHQSEPAESEMELIGANEDGPEWARGLFFAVADVACETEDDWLDLLAAIALASPRRVVAALRASSLDEPPPLTIEKAQAIRDAILGQRGK